MVRSRFRNIALGVAASALLIVAVAVPASADHTGGAELTDLGSAGSDSCYVGGLLSGIPTTLFTPYYSIRDHGGSRHLVCYFTTASSYTPSSDEGGYDWSWTAPRRLTTFLGGDATCVEPGGSADGYTEAAQSVPRFVEYKTSLVMYCSWPLADLAFP